jgi:hypothetical protein
MNKHIKTINGRKYYYSSVRKGKKVTSKYLGPVERIRSLRRKEIENLQEDQIQEESPILDEENYIG